MAAKNKFLNAMKMPSIDDMFSSEADRQRESGDLVTEVPLSELHPFVGHPFEVRDDEDMQKLVDSIRENGVLTNLTVRRRAEGGYEIISGHRRFHAAQRAGLIAVKVQVRDIDDDQAIIDMVDSNIQREHISPMEKARAYAMKLEAISRQGSRHDLTSAQVERKLESADIVGKEAGDSRMQVRRYIRLNSLVPDLQKKVDDGSLKFNPAVELSYLSPSEQNDFLDYIESQSCSPSLSQAQKLICHRLHGPFKFRQCRKHCAFCRFKAAGQLACQPCGQPLLLFFGHFVLHRPQTVLRLEQLVQ